MRWCRGGDGKSGRRVKSAAAAAGNAGLPHRSATGSGSSSCPGAFSSSTTGRGGVFVPWDALVGMHAARRQARQPHVGRHSQHNNSAPVPVSEAGQRERSATVANS